MKNSFENLYAAYCPLLYSVAIRICPSNQEAEKIVMLTFIQVYQQNIDWMDNKQFRIDLVNLTIQTAQEEQDARETMPGFRIGRFAVKASYMCNMKLSLFKPEV